VPFPAAPGGRAVREEIFGPVAAVIPFKDEDEAMRLAHDTIYGLSGSIWTRDRPRALRVAQAVEAGNPSVDASFVGHRANLSLRLAPRDGGLGSRLGGGLRPARDRVIAACVSRARRARLGLEGRRLQLASADVRPNGIRASPWTLALPMSRGTRLAGRLFWISV
jgi:hypothetical protein